MSDDTNALAADPERWHLEDYAEALAAGRRLAGGRYVVTEEEVLEFGRRFDPQPMHTDPVAAKEGPFGGLVAPGCLTFAIRNALYNQLPVRPALYAGLGLDQMLLPNPVAIMQQTSRPESAASTAALPGGSACGAGSCAHIGLTTASAGTPGAQTRA